MTEQQLFSKKHCQNPFLPSLEWRNIYFVKSPYALLFQSKNNCWFYIHIDFVHLNGKGESVNSDQKKKKKKKKNSLLCWHNIGFSHITF